MLQAKNRVSIGDAEESANELVKPDHLEQTINHS